MIFFQNLNQKYLIFSTNKVSRLHFWYHFGEKKKGKFCEIFDDFFILEKRFRSYHHDETISFHKNDQKNNIFFSIQWKDSHSYYHQNSNLNRNTEFKLTISEIIFWEKIMERVNLIKIEMKKFDFISMIWKVLISGCPMECSDFVKQIESVLDKIKTRFHIFVFTTISGARNF